MKKYLLCLTIYLITLGLFLSCDTDTNKMPYKAGVYVDEAKFLQQKELWDNNSVNNYTYTYIANYYFSKKKDNLLNNSVAEITVKDGQVLDVILKEIKKKTKEDLSQEEWNAKTEDFLNNYENKNYFLIENIYQKIDDSIKNAFTAYQKNLNNYYAEINFNYTNDLPYLNTYDSYTLLMDKDLDGIINQND